MVVGFLVRQEDHHHHPDDEEEDLAVVVIEYWEWEVMGEVVRAMGVAEVKAEGMGMRMVEVMGEV